MLGNVFALLGFFMVVFAIAGASSPLLPPFCPPLPPRMTPTAGFQVHMYGGRLQYRCYSSLTGSAEPQLCHPELEDNGGAIGVRVTGSARVKIRSSPTLTLTLTPTLTIILALTLTLTLTLTLALTLP